ncbi:hypothetical protein GG804_19025 [Sphingomonas histidinilytica]|uniref:hypothetical protein n=1 Tax=Rhizorhabdus histidinilytica TaxID=439228 RepID=UPI001ADCCFA0|nr:hypothetical protein [Rhizorhabdus histidinilytica]MBO9378864.1 hypothetical protein [Rhizorhabdus histidinilytica]
MASDGTMHLPKPASFMGVETMPKQVMRDDRPEASVGKKKRSGEGTASAQFTESEAVGVGSAAIVAALIYAKRK